jgi:DNA-binding response OmpR family regulator
VARVIALVEDLLFGSRVQADLSAAGHDVELHARPDDARTAARGADVLVVDLVNDEIDGVGLVQSMHDGGELASTRTLGFFSHIDEQVRDRAQTAGFDLVVPRSRMAREGGALVGRLLGG